MALLVDINWIYVYLGVISIETMSKSQFFLVSKFSLTWTFFDWAQFLTIKIVLLKCLKLVRWVGSVFDSGPLLDFAEQTLSGIVRASQISANSDWH